MQLKGRDWTQRLWQFEHTQVRYLDDPLPGEAAFCYRQGTHPVLISAPHGACHWRENRWKKQDGYTAALAYLLAAETGAHAIYMARRTHSDPNIEAECDYKCALAGLLREYPIRLVLDLHGASAARNFGLALGTIDGRSCPNYETLIIETFQTEAFTPNSDHLLDQLALNPPGFKGGVRQQTVTRFVWERCGVNAAQIEINSQLRVIHRQPTASAETAILAADPARQFRLIRALIGIILAI